MRYELYVCGRIMGCGALLNFEAESDKEAREIALDTIERYEDECCDYVYREYLYTPNMQHPSAREIDM